MSGERCGTCRFWNKLDPGHTYADCRRLPPTTRLTVSAVPQGAQQVRVDITAHPDPWWPNTPEGDWCGEWQEHDHAR